MQTTLSMRVEEESELAVTADTAILLKEDMEDISFWRVITLILT